MRTVCQNDLHNLFYLLWVPEGFFCFRGEAVIVSGEAAIEILDFDCSFTTKTKKPQPGTQGTFNCNRLTIRSVRSATLSRNVLAFISSSHGPLDGDNTFELILAESLSFNNRSLPTTE